MEAYWEGKKSRLLAEQESTLAKLAELEAREQLYFESTKAAKAELAAALGGAAPAAAPGAKIAQLAATEAVVSPEASEEIEALRLELMAAEMEREVDVQLTSAFWIERERKLKEAASAPAAARRRRRRRRTRRRRSRSCASSSPRPNWSARSTCS